MLKFYFLIMFILMFILPTILLITLKKHTKPLKILTIILSIAYFILLFIGTTFKISIKNNNLIIYPNFTNNWFSMRFLLYSFAKRNILINIALLFPIGFIVQVFCKKNKFLKTILYTFLLSLFIELYQFILPVSRTTELTDILFNTLGGFLSAAYCYILRKINIINKE